MGQYYKIVTMRNNRINVYDRSTKKTKTSEPEYMMAKLMEHSWIGNWTMDSISAKIQHKPTKIAWVGDYADSLDEEEIRNDDLVQDTVNNLYYRAWERDDNSKPMILRKFNYKNKLLVNWDKKQYIDMNEYLKLNSVEWNDRDLWCIHPLSLLTAIGNDLGGGDYHGTNMEMVGGWAFDRISFETNKRESELTGFTKLIDEDIKFIED